MRATLSRSYTHPAKLLAANQGSMQLLADGRVLVGWGNLPYFTEFAENGALLLDGQFPIGDQSYRAFTAGWTGHPTDKPAVAARVNQAGGSVVYASWNGATELSSWTVLAGSTATRLGEAGSQRRAGFETMITVNSSGPYFAVTANDASGHVLGRSDTVKLGARRGQASKQSVSWNYPPRRARRLRPGATTRPGRPAPWPSAATSRPPAAGAARCR